MVLFFRFCAILDSLSLLFLSQLQSSNGARIWVFHFFQPFSGFLLFFSFLFPSSFSFYIYSSSSTSLYFYLIYPTPLYPFPLSSSLPFPPKWVFSLLLNSLLHLPDSVFSIGNYVLCRFVVLDFVLRYRFLDLRPFILTSFSSSSFFLVNLFTVFLCLLSRFLWEFFLPSFCHQHFCSFQLFY